TGLRIFWIQLQLRAELLKRSIHIPIDRVGPRDHVVDQWIIRFSARHDCELLESQSAIICDRFLTIFADITKAQKKVSLQIASLKENCSLQRGYSLVILLLFGQDKYQIVVHTPV